MNINIDTFNKWAAVDRDISMENGHRRSVLDMFNILEKERKLENDFAAHKNSVIENSTGDYIFHIDADEYPNEILLQQLKQILEINDVDLIWVPRVNTVDGFTNEDVQRWGCKSRCTYFVFAHL